MLWLVKYLKCETERLRSFKEIKNHWTMVNLISPLETGQRRCLKVEVSQTIMSYTCLQDSVDPQMDQSADYNLNKLQHHPGLTHNLRQSGINNHDLWLHLWPQAFINWHLQPHQISVWNIPVLILHCICHMWHIIFLILCPFSLLSPMLSRLANHLLR